MNIEHQTIEFVEELFNYKLDKKKRGRERMKYKKYDYYKVYTPLGCILLTHVFNAVVAILYHIAR